MKITLEPTDQMQSIEGAQCRVWKGTTERGTEVFAFIRCVQPQTHDLEKLAEFERDLKSLPPFRRELVSFDYRMVAD